MAFTSCEDPVNGEKQELVDSISAMIGNYYGTIICNIVNSGEEANAVCLGVNYMMEADTTQMFMTGVEIAAQINKLVNDIENSYGVVMNKAQICRTLSECFESFNRTSKKPQEIDRHDAENDINGVLEQLPAVNGSHKKLKIPNYNFN
jgi:hypothetical protein